MNMVAKPMLFSTDMVRALLDGRKTVTRRVVKPRYRDDECGFRIVTRKIDLAFVRVELTDENEFLTREMNPPYQPGDVLYVPEAWKCRFAMLDQDGLGYEVVFRDGKIVRFRFENRKRAKKWAKYARKDDNHWQSPYFMPKEAARIFLRVTGVRVERLQDIDKWGAAREGQPSCSGLTLCGGTLGCPMCEAELENAIRWFSTMWDKPIKPADRALYGWVANPWVWVIEFERISREKALRNE